MTELPIDVGMSEEWVTRQEAEIERRRSAREESRMDVRVERLVPVWNTDHPHQGASDVARRPSPMVSIVIPPSLAREVVRALEARAQRQEDGEERLGEPNIDSTDLWKLAEKIDVKAARR